MLFIAEFTGVSKSMTKHWYCRPRQTASIPLFIFFEIMIYRHRPHYRTFFCTDQYLNNGPTKSSSRLFHLLSDGIHLIPTQLLLDHIAMIINTTEKVCESPICNAGISKTSTKEMYTYAKSNTNIKTGVYEMPWI